MCLSYGAGWNLGVIWQQSLKTTSSLWQIFLSCVITLFFWRVSFWVYPPCWMCTWMWRKEEGGGGFQAQWTAWGESQRFQLSLCGTKKRLADSVNISETQKNKTAVGWMLEILRIWSCWLCLIAANAAFTARTADPRRTRWDGDQCFKTVSTSRLSCRSEFLWVSCEV